MNKFIPHLLSIADLILTPFVFPAAWLLKQIRGIGVDRLPHCREALRAVGVFPIRNHYYEPQFDFSTRTIDYTHHRKLPGIRWNASEQLTILTSLTFSGELLDTPQGKPDRIEFYFNNGAFEAGDAEYWYQLIRATKPRRIFEIGGGYSTLMAIKAIGRNRAQDVHYECEHVCIEPYEMPWLEQTEVSLVRKHVEDVGLLFFSRLEAGDVLFIDSSHVIRPSGDVLFEYLELLPALRKGVIVHIHDIFSPRNYLRQWIEQEVRFWNEQYLLEAFLSHNDSWQIIGALNWLHHHHYEQLKAIAPFLAPEREPGSFYIRKIA